jgi:hypothetical protein
MEQRDKRFQPRFCLLQRYLLQLQQERAIKPKTVGKDSRVVAEVALAMAVMTLVMVAVVVVVVELAVVAAVDAVDVLVAKDAVVITMMAKTTSLLVQESQRSKSRMAVKRSGVECVGIGLGVTTMRIRPIPAPTNSKLIQPLQFHQQFSSNSQAHCHLHCVITATTIHNKDNKFTFKELLSTKKQDNISFLGRPACN